MSVHFITVKKKERRSKHVNWFSFLFLRCQWASGCACQCGATCICAHRVQVMEGWGWIASECVRADLLGSAAQRMAEWCSPPDRHCASNTQTPAYFTNKCWLVCLASAPPQINSINALQILVFSLITKLGALLLNPQQSLRMETAGCVFVCAYQANYTAMPLVSFAWREYLAPVCLLLFILTQVTIYCCWRIHITALNCAALVCAAEYECI